MTYTMLVPKDGHGCAMMPVGRGAFPYDCEARDKFPHAMVYECREHGCWSHSSQPDHMFGTIAIPLPDVCPHENVGYIGRDPASSDRNPQAMVECRACGLILPFAQSGHYLAFLYRAGRAS